MKIVTVPETDPDEQARRLAAEGLRADDATGWFEHLYAAADEGEAVVPWDRETPRELLVEWAERKRLDGSGQRALVVGAGLGTDAEFVAGFGFDTIAFDVSPTAVRVARERHPGSRVEYLVADLLDPPADWRGAFDLVVEIITVQALPVRLHELATANIAAFVAPGGTLFVLAAARDEADGDVDGPPWPLTRAEIEAFAGGDLSPVLIEEIRRAGDHRWRAEFLRDS
jgi:SAM-dependent methyltransferase